MRYTMCNALSISVASRYTMYAHNNEANDCEDRKFTKAYNPTRDSGDPQGKEGRRGRVWDGQWKCCLEESQTLRMWITSNASNEDRVLILTGLIQDGINSE